jgi:hypothetical protein
VLANIADRPKDCELLSVLWYASDIPPQAFARVHSLTHPRTRPTPRSGPGEEEAKAVAFVPVPCSHCGRPSDIFFPCTECACPDGESFSVFYCSSHCQSADRARHAPLCARLKRRHAADAVFRAKAEEEIRQVAAQEAAEEREREAREKVEAAKTPEQREKELRAREERRREQAMTKEEKRELHLQRLAKSRAEAQQAQKERVMHGDRWDRELKELQESQKKLEQQRLQAQAEAQRVNELYDKRAKYLQHCIDNKLNPEFPPAYSEEVIGKAGKSSTYKVGVWLLLSLFVFLY